MINSEFLLFLGLGTVAMLIPILIISLKYGIKIWKSVLVALALTITGTIGTYIWFFVEASWFGGRSYYGAVFIVPLIFIFFSKIIRIPYGELMDLCAPSECLMLAIMKYQCLVEGCCGGRALYVLEGKDVCFPSQITELVNALLIMVALMLIALIGKGKWRGKIYPWYLIVYGVTRFILNFLRDDLSPLLLGLPAGNLWSLLSIAIGLLWLTDRKVQIIKKSEIQS